MVYLIYIFSPDEALLAILRPEGPGTPSVVPQQYTQQMGQYIGTEDDGTPAQPGACPFFADSHRERLNSIHTFSFSVPADHPDAAYVSEHNQVAIRDLDNDWLLFEIKRIVDTQKADYVKTAVCEISATEMLDDHIGDRRLTNVGAEFALDQALTGTRWQTGIVDSLGSGSVRFFRTNPIAAINQIIGVWGGERRFRVTISDTGQITGRYVDLLAMRGSSTGKRFEDYKDLQEVERTVDSSNIKTALYGYGKGEETDDGYGRRITFADIEWSIAAGDPAEKPLGQEWVGDAGALAEWGRESSTRHRLGQYENPDIEDPEELLHATWQELQRLKEPLVNYKMKVVLLESNAGLEHEAVRLGDSVGIISRRFNPVLTVGARIIEYRRSLSRPEEGYVELGNFLPDITQDRARLQALQSKVHDRSGIWNEKITAGRSYKSVYIDGDTGLAVLDEMNVARILLGEYLAGKYGLRAYDAGGVLRAVFGESPEGKHGVTIYSKDGGTVVLDEDGVVDAYQVNASDNLSGEKPLNMRVYVPPNVSRVDSLKLSAYTEPFRAYQQAGLPAEGSLKTTQYQVSETLNTYGTWVSDAFTIQGLDVGLQWDRNDFVWVLTNQSSVDVTIQPLLFYESSPGSGSFQFLASWGSYKLTRFASFGFAKRAASFIDAAAKTQLDGKRLQLQISVFDRDPTTVYSWSAISNFTWESIAKHTHVPVYEIYEGDIPSSVELWIDSVDLTLALGGPWGGPTSVEIGPLDITQHIQTTGWHEVQFRTQASPASLTTSFAAANSNLKFSARQLGPEGELISIAGSPLSPSPSSTLVLVYGKFIVLALGTASGGAVNATAAQVKAAIEAHPDANALISVEHVAGSDGSGVVKSFFTTHLAGHISGLGRITAALTAQQFIQTA